MTKPILRSSPLAALGTVAAGAAAWGVLVERNMFTLRRLSAAALPEGAPPIRVLHISDLHLAPWQSRKTRFVAELADLQPDLVVSTGDLMGHPGALEKVREALEPFRDIPGVFVHGSNDYYAPVPKNPLRYLLGPSRTPREAASLDIEALNQFLGDLGWVDLNNSAAALKVAGVPLEFMGVNDAHRGWDQLGKMAGAVDDLRGGYESKDDAEASPTLTIGVTHAPYRRVLNSFVTYGARMVFAGHTHGGQVRIPGIGAIVTNCDLPRAQARGLSIWTHTMRSAFLHVSAGLGTSIYQPIRFACPPEATLLTLEPIKTFGTDS